MPHVFFESQRDCQRGGPRNADLRSSHHACTFGAFERFALLLAWFATSFPKLWSSRAVLVPTWCLLVSVDRFAHLSHGHNHSNPTSALLSAARVIVSRCACVRDCIEATSTTARECELLHLTCRLKTSPRPNSFETVRSLHHGPIHQEGVGWPCRASDAHADLFDIGRLIGGRVSIAIAS